MRKPINGLYMTNEDSQAFHQWFSESYNKKYGTDIADTDVKNITIVLTEDCNFDCTYCYQHQKNPRKLTKEKAREIVDFILDSNKMGDYASAERFPGVILDFIGGEPLLAIDSLSYFVEYFKNRTIELDHPWKTNYMISISSNGSMYKDERVQKFLRENPNRVSIGISIDGNKELHDSCRIYKDSRKGTYDDVLDAVKLWVEQNPGSCTTKATFAPENIQYLVESIIHLFELGITTVPANPVFENVWEADHARLFYKKLKELADRIVDEDWYLTHYCSIFSEITGDPLDPEDNNNWCGGDGKMLAIDAEGVAYPCLRYMKYCFSTEDRKPLIIGNIYDGLSKKEEEYEVIKGLQSITRSSQSTEECFNCPIAQGCSWCSAYNYDVYGTANKRTTFHCEMHKARVMANVYFWNKLYKKVGVLRQYPMNVPKEWVEQIASEDEYNLLMEMGGHKDE